MTFTIHLPGIPHTIAGDPRFSHCAFTGKVERFAEMMAARGHTVIHYGVGEVRGGTNVPLLTPKEQAALLGHGHDDPTRFFGLDTDVSSPLYQRFNERLREVLSPVVQPGHIIALPFGHAHSDALGPWSNQCLLVETGIGYRQTVPGAFHIYESEAWRNWHLGKDDRNPSDYEFVIPNYYHPGDWSFGSGSPTRRYVYAGRIQDDKGLRVIQALALHRPDCHFTIYGQGDPTPYLSENVEYGGVLGRDHRSQVFGSATALLAPSRYLEPFCGVAVEAMLCGTPVISSNHGAFCETNTNGFRCNTLQEWSDALDHAHGVGGASRSKIQRDARTRYSYDTVSRLYEAAFGQLADLYGNGWFTTRRDT